ncbi:MAG: single-stranded DNA-binding protein [Proteobacteria bacterium]|nr:single-stranded DNA-binding protein [Pseudomonadota bacterium]
MSESTNIILIVGRLGRDPEFHQGPNTQFARFSLAHSSQYNGQKIVQWHNICAFGKQAQICQNHLHKGDLCCIEGQLDCSSYEKDGQKRYSHSIIAKKVTFLSPKRKPDIQPSDLTSSDTVDEAIPF